MLDRAAFLKPIAHRGLHAAAEGRIENTEAAFTAAIARGFGIECDLRPAAGGLPVVFHDETLERLIDGRGPVAALSAGDLRRLRYKGEDTPILTLAALLDLVAGKVPLLIEVKSEWAPPDPAFMAGIARLASAYHGPIALMSFDPAVMTALRLRAPGVPRGIVSGAYRDEHGGTWWRDKIDETRAFRLANLLDSAPVEPHFYAYHVKALPTPVTRYVREVQKLPLFTWTVRTPEDHAIAAQWADAPIFEGNGY
jgi:glycerophosphoryl diester phosphodiesterase